MPVGSVLTLLSSVTERKIAVMELMKELVVVSFKRQKFNNRTNISSIHKIFLEGI